MREIGVLRICHFWWMVRVSVDIEGRCFLVVELSANVQTKHIALFTGYRQDKTVAPLLHQEDLLSVAVQNARQLQLAHAEAKAEQGQDEGLNGRQ